MTKKVCVLFALLLVVAFAAPAMAASGTWIGGVASDPTGWIQGGNWSGGQPYHSPDNVYINNLSKTAALVNDWANPNPDIIYDSFTGGVNSLGSTFTITSTAGSISPAGANVSAGSTLAINLNGGSVPSSNTSGQPNFWTWTAAPTAVLNLSQMSTTPAMVVNGGGLVTLSQSNTMNNSSVSITGGTTYTVLDNNGYTFNALTGDATSILNIGAATINSANFGFLGQINYTGATSGRFGFDTSAPAVVGANIQLGGTSNGAYALEAGYNGTNTTFTDCKFTGDGMINATNGAQALGTPLTMISNGSTFAASPTNYALTSTANGQLTLYGNLSLGQDGSLNNSQIVAAVMGNGSTNGGVCKLGTDYTQFAAPHTSGSLGGQFTCPDSSNPLAQTNLVVNITRGLSTGVNSTNLGTVGTDPFAGQVLTIVSAANTNFSGNPFANVKFVGGFATVGYSNGSITLSGIFSNPTLAGDINNDGLVDVADYDIWAANVGMTGATWLQGDLNGDGLVDVADYDIWAANVGATSATPEPISMIILAIGGGLVAIKRRNG
jgi:hypothetical protein